MKREVRSWGDRMMSIDQRYIYAILALAVLFPLVRPMGLPSAVPLETQATYEQIEQLNPGDLVILCLNVSPTTEPETWPQTVALARHLMGKEARVVIIHLIPDGVMYAQRLMNEIMPEGAYEYGEDVVLMGFNAGGESVVSALADDFTATYTTDYLDTPIGQIPMLADMTGLRSAALYIDVVHMDSTHWAVRHVAGKGVPVVAAVTAVFTPRMLPFYASGQLKGVISGIAGGAAYEQLVGAPGAALAAMDAQSLGHTVIVLAVLLGNLGYFATRRPQRGTGDVN